MIKKTTKLLVTALFLSIVSISGMAFATAAQDAACAGAGSTVNATTGCTPPAGSASIDGTIAAAVNIFSIIIGLVGVIMLMVGGLKYVTSQGDGGQVSSAKNTILYAIVGLVIGAMAQIIAKTVLNKIR